MLILGIDGGGTSATCWLADGDGLVLGRGKAGPSNARVIGDEAARVALVASMEAAFADAGIARRTVDSACFGLAGFDRPDERRLLETWNREAGWSRRLVTANDAELVLEAGTPDGWGVALISGTGSIAFGRTPDGRTARAGGWGPLFGDEGSAYALALKCIQVVAQRADGILTTPPNDLLTPAVLDAVGIAEPSQLVRLLDSSTWDRARIAALAPVLVALLEREKAALEFFSVVVDPAMELARMARAVRIRLKLGRQPTPTALAGGFLLGCEPLHLHVLIALTQMKRFDPITEVADPVEGAIRLARKALE